MHRLENNLFVLWITSRSPFSMIHAKVQHSPAGLLVYGVGALKIRQRGARVFPGNTWMTRQTRLSATPPYRDTNKPFFFSFSFSKFWNIPRTWPKPKSLLSSCLHVFIFEDIQVDQGWHRYTNTHIMEEKLFSRFHLKRPLISQRWFRSRCRRDEERSRGETKLPGSGFICVIAHAWKRVNPNRDEKWPSSLIFRPFLKGCNETGLAESENHARPVTFSKAGRNWFHWSSRAE